MEGTDQVPEQDGLLDEFIEATEGGCSPDLEEYLRRAGSRAEGFRRRAEAYRRVCGLLGEIGSIRSHSRSLDRRRHPRRDSRPASAALRIRFPGDPGGCSGEGRLCERSPGGFRIDRLSLEKPSIPPRGTPFSFEIREGPLAGITGTAQVAWASDQEPVLGVQICRFGSERAREAWAREGGSG